MALKVITTVGTSIFSNYQKKETIEKLDNKYQSINDVFDRLDKLSANDYNISRWKSPIRNIKEKIEIIWLPFAQEEATNASKFTNASAEIETLYKIAHEEQQHLDVYLLATDTILSVLACELIKEWFDKYPSVKDTDFKIKCYFYGDINAPDTTIVKGLQVKDADRFETEGFNNLLNIIEKYSEKGKTILNISGGYKAVIPFLTLFAQLKEIPLKYAYEDSGELITVGNLPFSFDWAIVEALKPFLNINHPIWTDEAKELAQLLFNKDIYFDNNQRKFKVKETNLIEKIEGKENKLFIFKHLFDNKLLTGNLQVSALGTLLKKVQQLETYRGYEMEYMLYHYFSNDNKDVLVQNYSTIKAITLMGSFKFEGSVINIRDNKAKDQFREFGDIDLSLEREGIIVLGEIKAFSKLFYYADALKGQKYYEQIEARLHGFVQQHENKITKPELEFLIIVFQFQFEGFEDSLAKERVISICEKFKQIENTHLETSTGIKVKPILTVLGLKCLIELNHKKLSANYTSFYQKPKFSWEKII
jgi:hypothetical protein